MTADRQKLLSLYEDLRVADVRDGMDTMGQHYIGSMSPDMRPLWRTAAHGIARTCRYLPGRAQPPKLAPEEYWDWAGTYYRDVCTYPWVDKIEQGDFVVIDMSGLNVGLMGSENTLSCVRKGARGLICGGGVRDTDEIIMQKVPVWSTMCSQPMVQGRIEFEAMDVAVGICGVQVCPGDVVVADGDGVIVVPSEIAQDVARYAHEEHDRDKKNRGKHYEALGWDKDGTVK